VGDISIWPEDRAAPISTYTPSFISFKFEKPLHLHSQNLVVPGILSWFLTTPLFSSPVILAHVQKCIFQKIWVVCCYLSSTTTRKVWIVLTFQMHSPNLRNACFSFHVRPASFPSAITSYLREYTWCDVVKKGYSHQYNLMRIMLKVFIHVHNVTLLFNLPLVNYFYLGTTLLSHLQKITLHFLWLHTHNRIPGSFFFEWQLSAEASHSLVKLIVLHFQGLRPTCLLPPFYDCKTHGFGGLGVACRPLVPKFAGSNPAEAVGFLRAKISSARLPSEGK